MILVSVLYVIIIEAIICGLMLNRTLYSVTKHMWHLPIYVLIKASVCTYIVYTGMIYLVTPLCVIFSLVYSLICFNDSLKRKLAVIICGVLCLTASNILKFAMLDLLNLTQDQATTRNVLATEIVLCFSLLFFCLFTIICTNIMCRVRIYIIFRIALVHLLLLTFIAMVYIYMHALIPYRFNSLYTVFALFFLLPAAASLYFSESLVSTNKDNYFRPQPEHFRFN